MILGVVWLLCVTLLSPAAAPPDSLRVTPVVQAYRKASPAVVNISTQRLVSWQSQFFGGEDDPFEDFMPRSGPQVQAASLGSGFVIHPDGFIITNAHVVRRAQKITVTFPDKSTYDAAIVAANADHDLAVLRIENAKARKFPHIALGRSDDLMIGETVLAIGNPMGLQNTCTTGIVSALDRVLEFRGGASYKGLIQIDAPINPGNSGGPLLNVEGRLIGINTAIRADAQGIGFAIPADALAVDLPRLLDYERINRVIIGLDVKLQHGRQAPEAVVAAVAPDSPAAGADCRAGDYVLSVNDQPVADLADFHVAMLRLTGGANVKFTLRREGKTVETRLKVASRPKPDGAALAHGLFGLELLPITPELVKRFGLPVEAGLVMATVEPGSPAANLGLKRGDVLFQLGRWTIVGLEQLGGVLEDVKSGEVLRLGIIRGNTRAWGNIQAGRVQRQTTTSRPGTRI